MKFHFCRPLFLSFLLLMTMVAPFLFTVTPVQAAGIAYVQSNINFSGSNLASLGVTLSSSVTTGNAIVVTITSFNNLATGIIGNVTDNKGNTYHKAIGTNEAGTSDFGAIWYATNVTGGSSFTVTATPNANAQITITAIEYSGIVGLDVTGTSTGSGTSGTSASITNTHANEVFVAYFNFFDNLTLTQTVGGGWNDRQDQGDNNSFEALYTQDKIVSAIGANQASISWTGGSTTAYWGGIAGFYGQSNTSSANYVLRNYGFGGGGTATSSSATYAVNGILGQVESASASSAKYNAKNGLSYLQEANEPPPPTFTNPSSYYNKLFLTINTGGNPSDTKYAIALSPNAFTSSTLYVQADDTLGANPVFQTNAVWGASGFNVIGLIANTTYSAKVSAMDGKFSQSPFGTFAQATTSNSTFSMSITPNSVSIGSLTPGTVTTSGTTVTSTISTNGAGGGVIYVYDSNAGLLSPSTSYTISAVSSDLAVTSEGYGVQGGSPAQSSGGPMEVLSPFNVTTTNVGALSSTKKPIFDSTGAPVTSGTAVMTFKAKAGNTAKAATDYTDTITVIGSATF